MLAGLADRASMNCSTAAETACARSGPGAAPPAAAAASAVCTRLLTLTVLMSGLVPSAKVTVRRVAAVVAAGRPHVDHLVDADRPAPRSAGRRSPPPPRPRRRDRSRSPAPAAARCPGTAPPGCAASRAAPAIVMTMAMTIASRGRSTKTAEIIGCGAVPLACAGRRLDRRRGRSGRRPAGRGGRAACPRRSRFSPSASPLVTTATVGRRTGRASRGAAPPCCRCRRRRRSRPAGRPAPRRAARRCASHRLHALQHDRDELAVDQLARAGSPWLRRTGLGIDAAQHHGVGVAVTVLSTKSSWPVSVIEPAVGQAHADHAARSSRLGRVAVAQLEHRARRRPGRATYIGSWLTMVASVPAPVPTTVADRHRGAADLAVDRRAGSRCSRG